MSISISITKDTAGPAIADLAARLDPQRLAAAVGPACSRLIQRHIRALPGNKKGWPRTQFWADAARATNWTAAEGGAIISVNKIGFRQRYYGGPIKPVNTGALTIPISPVSYGHAASEFPGLFLLRTAKGAYLVQKLEAAFLGKSKRGEKLAAKRKTYFRELGGNASKRVQADLSFLFMLSQGVDQAPNPDVIPTREALAAEAKTAILAAIKPDEKT